MFGLISSDSEVTMPDAAWQEYLDPDFRVFEGRRTPILTLDSLAGKKPTRPNSRALTDEWLAAFGEEEKARILWKNCATLYGLQS